MAAADTATGSRRSYVTITCRECGEPREMTDRSARRVRAGKIDGTCRRCRTLGRLAVTDEHREWARQTLAAMTPDDRALVMLAFSGIALD